MIPLNKLLLWLNIFLLLPVFCHAEVSLKQLFDKLRPSVVTVISYDSNLKFLQQGTGFFVNSNGNLITNYHVLQNAFTADIEIKKGHKYRIANVLAANESLDIIKVKVDIPPNLYKWININPVPPTTAEKIIVIGSPMGLAHTISEGIVSAIRVLPDFGNIYQISAPISPGSSGSPVINMSGEVIGIATFQFFQGQNLNFAVPSLHIQSLNDYKKPKLVSVWNKWSIENNDKKLQKSLSKLIEAPKAPEKKIISYTIPVMSG